MGVSSRVHKGLPDMRKIFVAFRFQTSNFGGKSLTLCVIDCKILNKSHINFQHCGELWGNNPDNPGVKRGWGNGIDVATAENG